MIKSVAVTLLLCAYAFGASAANAGLIGDLKPPQGDVADMPACEGSLFLRGLKYTDSEQNVIDVAVRDASNSRPRPVLLFVAGESFGNDSLADDWAKRIQAICLAARSGMVGVTMSYRRAPEHSWPAGARDVAAAVSWVYRNADLFGGDPRAILAIGHSVGAFHLANLLGRKEFQESGVEIAGAILISGVYVASPEGPDAERTYFGADISKYDDRSAVSGISAFESPLVVAWSSEDSPRQIAEGERLSQHLCETGHCPRIARLTDQGSPASVFDRDGPGRSLAERMNQLISQIEMRGLP